MVLNVLLLDKISISLCAIIVILSDITECVHVLLMFITIYMDKSVI